MHVRRWTLLLGSAAAVAVAASASSARRADTDAALFAVNLRTGIVRWTVRPAVTGLPWVDRAARNASRLAAYGYLAGGSCAGPFWNLVFDAATGRQRARTPASGSRDEQLLRSRLDRVTVGGLTFAARWRPNDHLTRVEARTRSGRLKWSRAFRVDFFDVLTAGSGVVVIEFRRSTATRDVTTIVTMNRVTGRPLWRKTSLSTSARPVRQVVAVGNGQVYVDSAVSSSGQTTSTLRALAALTARQRWQRPIDSVPAALLAGGGTVAVVGEQGATAAFHAADGRPSWNSVLPTVFGGGYGRAAVIGGAGYVPVSGEFDGCS